MLFIPQEVKDKLSALESKNEALEAENQQLREELKNPMQKKGSNPAAWLLGILLVLALLALGYMLFFYAPSNTTIEQEEEKPNREQIIIADGKIEKWQPELHGDVVYRVQLGAYQNFDIEKYKHNIEGLHRDSIDGFHKVSLGAFSYLADAQNFLDEMLRLGLENCYIVAYKNDIPIGLIEAKETE